MNGRPSAHPSSAARAVAAEAFGSALLLATVVGSGVMGERLAGGSAAVALLANTLATSAMLFALIAVLGGVSAARLNPLVTLLALARGRLRLAQAAAEIVAQVVGAVVGVVAAHAMFDLPLFETSRHVRAGAAQLLSEGIATLGLVVVVGVGAERARTQLPLAVSSYVAAGYWFTASTCFANPAVTLARSLSDSFAGIRPHDVPGFLVAQFVGAAFGGVLVHWWTGTEPSPSPARAEAPAEDVAGSTTASR